MISRWWKRTLSSSSVWMPLTIIPFTALPLWATPPTRTPCAGVENCDAVAAVTEEDSVNLMAAQLAKNIFRRDKVICRVSDPHLQILYHKAYELETICPTVLTEQAVFRALSK